MATDRPPSNFPRLSVYQQRQPPVPLRLNIPLPRGGTRGRLARKAYTDPATNKGPYLMGLKRRILHRSSDGKQFPKGRKAPKASLIFTQGNFELMNSRIPTGSIRSDRRPRNMQTRSPQTPWQNQTYITTSHTTNLETGKKKDNLVTATG